jgi:hypothetical protein
VKSIRPLGPFDVTAARQLGWMPSIGTTRGLKLTFCSADEPALESGTVLTRTPNRDAETL